MELNYELFKSMSQNTTVKQVVVTGFIFLGIWTLKKIVFRKIRKSDIPTEDKRRWFVGIRNYSSLVLGITFIIIWSTELQTFAFSVAAVAAAALISGKELILCLHGGFLRSLNGLFKIGDRIEVDGIRGDVIDISMTTTKILEIGPQNYTHQFTGRAISIPNAIFLTKTVTNESFLHHYVLHVFKMPFRRSEDWQEAERCMLAAAQEECSEFIDLARKNFERIGSREGLEVPKVEPRITYRFNSATEVEMIIRIPAPARKKGNIEQAILRSFMKKYSGIGNEQEES